MWQQGQRRGRATGAGVIALVLAGCIAQAGAQKAAVYPTELHGFWIPAEAKCPQAGESFDGDLMMHISPSQLQGYEDISKPVTVTQISQAPKAWRIQSLIDIGPSGHFEEDDPQIFVLGKSRVTVVSDTRTEVFQRCSQQ